MHFKQRESHIFVISDLAVKELKNLKYQYDFVVLKNISLNIYLEKINQCLKNTSVQNVADTIGHKDIKSTMAYKRYALNKKKIQKLLNKIDNSNTVINGRLF